MNKLEPFLIDSVIGFDTNVVITDRNKGMIKPGAKTVINFKSKKRKINSGLIDKTFFTNYNEALLNKIRDFKRLND